MLNFSANISTMFTEWPLPDRFAVAADAGFAAVEIQFPYAFAAGDLAARREAAGVDVVLLNIPAGDMQRGELGLACLSDRRAAFADAVARAADYCAALACPQVNCLSGRVPDAGARDRCWATLIENTAAAAATLAGAGVRLLVEPLNRVDQPDFLLASLADADALIAVVGHANIGLQYDTYHVRANGDEDWLGGIAPRLPHIGHIQFSDYPGRGEPGAGTLDFAAFFALMAALPYAGWTGAEYRPTGSTLASLGWLETAIAEAGRA